MDPDADAFFARRRRVSATEEANRPVQIGFFLVYVVVAVGVFSLLVLRPARKRHRAQQELVSAVKAGDRVVTTDGMCGTVREARDGSVVVEIAERTKVRLQRKAIAQVLSPEMPKASRRGAPKTRRRSA